jgi:cation:H+ antiporter
MPTAIAIPAFLASLAGTLLAARTLAERLDRLGVRFGFPEALIGLLTALAADGPEISSALVALAKGDHSVSVGVLVGSNAFNLAAMIGISALLAGAVQLARAALWLEGLITALITLLAGAVLMQWLAVPVAAGLAGCALAVYLAVVIGGYELLEHRAMPERMADGLGRALASRGPHKVAQPPTGDSTHHMIARMALDVLVIIAGSFAMVQLAVLLGDRWHVSRPVLGVLVLAPLTSIPNAFTGIRLGLAGRGAALVGETFNSNTINLAFGVIVPGLFTAAVALGSTAKLQLGWLVAMTLVCLILLAAPRGMRRLGGALLIALYAGFLATQLA